MNIIRRWNLMKGMGSRCPARKAGTILTAVCLVAVLGYAVTEVIHANMKVTLLEARERASKAEVAHQEVLDVLSGNLVMTEELPPHRAKIATVTWELVERRPLVGGLK